MTSVLKVDNIQNSSGTSALSIQSDGGFYPKGLTYWPFIEVRKTSNQTAASNGEKITFPTEVSDDGGNWNGTDTFTAPISGVYMVQGQFLTQNNTQDVDVGLYVNGADRGLSRSPASSGHESVYVNRAIKLSANDTVDIRLLTSGDVIYASASFWTTLAIAYVGG